MHEDRDASTAGGLPALVGGRFERGPLLGMGGASWVFACKDRTLRCRAALKVLRDHSEDARRRFADEAVLLANLRHPHLVHVLAAGEMEDDSPFLALEMLPGRTLQARLEAEGPLPWREVVELTAQAARALAALHAHGVIHRDVKPSNLVQIRSVTGRPFIKLIDLGTAKVEDWRRVQAAGLTPPPRHQTDVGLVVGTPGFYPPEAPDAAPDPRFDVFGLGVTIYLLCTGVIPDRASLRPMQEVRPAADIPRELDELVASALAERPDERLATAAEFRARLETIRGARKVRLFDGCYELIELLGAGAKGEVHRAYHHDAERYVALKLLRAGAGREERQRFVREARVLRAVSHPSLPTLVDCRTRRRKRPFIAMSLARGQRASDFCLEATRLAPTEVIAVGKAIAGALTALHARGILHRDINNSNVLIDLETRTATLVDFGMAALTDRYYATAEVRYLTRPDRRARLNDGGRDLDWTAPEAKAGKGWTEKSDVFSLAHLLYRMLTGKRPTGGKTGVPTSPTEHGVDCPLALESAILGGLEEDPQKRLDVQDFIAELDAAEEELADQAREAEAASANAPGQAAEATASPAHAVASESPVAAGPGAHEVAPALVPAPPPEPSGVTADEGREPSPGPHISPAARRRVPRTWMGQVARAAVAGLALGLAWWGGRMSAPSAPPVPPEREVVAAVSEPQTAARVVADEPVPPPLPTMQEALALASGSLRRCAGLADGPMLVHFETVAGADRFSAVDVRGVDEDMVRRCVRDATAPLRFRPAEAESFTREYTP